MRAWRSLVFAAVVALAGCNAILGNEEGVLIGSSGDGGTGASGASVGTSGAGASAGAGATAGSSTGAAGEGGSPQGAGGVASAEAGTGGAPVEDPCGGQTLRCNGKQREQCDEQGNWQASDEQCEAGKVCTGAGLCAKHRLRGGITGFAEHVDPLQSQWFLKEQTLSQFSRVCNDTHCVSGGIAP